MRLAIAGLGTATMRGHIPAIARVGARDGVVIAALADTRAEQRDAAAAALSGIPIFASAEAMLDTVACDVVLVATEPGAHGALAEAALSRGLHLICEKPFVLSRAEHEHLARYAASSSSAIVPVHQYLYAQPAAALVRAARIASRLRQPFALRVEVRRPGPDQLAATDWRFDVERSGGMLADHGVHYLALAWNINEQLDVVSFAQSDDRSDILLHLGAGTAALHFRAADSERSTRIELSVGTYALAWSNEGFEVRVAGRRVCSIRGDGLASRAYVDGLYEAFYSDVARNLPGNVAWRQRRTAETLIVSRTLLSLLEQAGVQRAV